jgi:hypothetical protein
MPDRRRSPRIDNFGVAYRLLFGDPIDRPQGTWFVLHDSWLHFAKLMHEHRWVLAEGCDSTQPTAPMFFRSTTQQTGYPHREQEHLDHAHLKEWPGCMIDERGWIQGEVDENNRTDVPRYVKSVYLNEETRSCLEPEEKILRAVDRMFRSWCAYRRARGLDC